MQKTTTLFSLLALTTLSFAQSPRISLFEEFTGENCPPCATTNPVIDPFLATHQGIDCITLKWQVAIPSTPSSPISLYQQNKLEIDARDSYYSITSAPSAKLDGQAMGVFGTVSSSNPSHAGNINNPLIAASSAITSPFTISMTRAWDATFSAITVSVTLTATGNYTTTGTNLKYRLVMTEKEINYATAPGSNGEKQFHWVARKSFPTLAAGTAMANTWTVGQTQTFTISCPLPNYIWSRTEVELVGFIQDDSNKKVLQAALSVAAPVQDDAEAVAVTGIPPLTCNTSLNPVAVIKNNGINAISSMTINPFVNGIANGTSLNWTGTLAPGASTTITLTPITGLTVGNKTFSINISSNVNGSLDYNLTNNNKTIKFSVVGAYTPAPITQPFLAGTFPPINWLLINPDGGSATWARVSNAGSQSTTQSARYPAYNILPGDVDELVVAPLSLAGFGTALLNFDVAYAQYQTDDDKLDVFVSTDCGVTWTNVFSKSGSSLSTAPPKQSAFIPTAAQWRAESINLNAYANNATVLVKFTATSDYGNNMYIDQINISGVTGINKIDNNFASIELFPNPTVNETAVSINLLKSSLVTINVLNNVGQLVYQAAVTLDAGENKINLDTKHFASGIYNVLIATESGSVSKKLVITK